MTDAGGPREIAERAVPGSARLVPPGDAPALAAAVGDAVTALGPTAAAHRAGRRPLQAPQPERIAAVLRAVVRGADGGSGAGSRMDRHARRRRSGASPRED
ncbi:MAG: hypothetical protein AMXMBFR46_17960 [Acidimicrobiia bacterium]